MDWECHQLAAGGPSSLRLPSRSRPCGEVSRLGIRAPHHIRGQDIDITPWLEDAPPHAQHRAA